VEALSPVEEGNQDHGWCSRVAPGKVTSEDQVEGAQVEPILVQLQSLHVPQQPSSEPQILRQLLSNGSHDAPEDLARTM